jgi:hypothetical protein
LHAWIFKEDWKLAPCRRISLASTAHTAKAVGLTLEPMTIEQLLSLKD